MRLNILFFLFILFIVLFSCNKKNKDNSDNLLFKDSVRISSFLNNLDSNYLDNNNNLIHISDSFLSTVEINSAQTTSKIALLHLSKSNYFLAEYYFNKSANLFLKDSLTIKYSEQIANAGVVKELSGLYTDAIQNYLIALNVFDSLNLELKRSKILNNIGIVYQQINENEKALEYYFSSLGIAKKLNNDDLCAIRYNNIATVFEEQEVNIDSALYFYKKAFDIWKNNTDKSKLSVIVNNMGYVYLLKNNLTKAATTTINKTFFIFLKCNIDPIANVTNTVFASPIICKI